MSNIEIRNPKQSLNPNAETRKTGRDPQIWICAVLALAIVLPRALLISSAHSAYVDDEHHLDQGLTALRRQHHPVTYYDPPLGKMILAAPLYVIAAESKYVQVHAGSTPPRTPRTVIYFQRFSPETIRLILGAWKALLFVPCVVVVFVWCRQLYGPGSAWLAVALFLIDPTITAHAAVPALDVLAMEAVIIASFLVWRYFERGSTLRLAAAAIAVAAAVQIKHTAIFLPAGVVLLAILHWFVRSWWQGRSPADLRSQIRPRFNSLANGLLLMLLSMWSMTLFDFSAPDQQKGLMKVAYNPGFSIKDDVLMPALSIRIPGGVYIGSLVGAFEHSGEGQSCFLWGERSVHGWWYYFPVLALYKVPLGVWLVLLLAVVSYALARPRWSEVFVFLPLVACATLVINSGINVGFRHAIPTYGLLLILASRAVLDAGVIRTVLAWLGVAAAAIHSLAWHPDYITYINAPWRRPYLSISDSNVDWGQSLRQLVRWLDDHPQPSRTIYLDPFNQMDDPGLDHYLGERARVLCLVDPAPRDGLLIISPTRLAGIYFVNDKYAWLRDIEPDDVIGHCLLVYDLDRSRARGILKDERSQYTPRP